MGEHSRPLRESVTPASRHTDHEQDRYRGDGWPDQGRGIARRRQHDTRLLRPHRRSPAGPDLRRMAGDRLAGKFRLLLVSDATVRNHLSYTGHRNLGTDTGRMRRLRRRLPLGVVKTCLKSPWQYHADPHNTHRWPGAVPVPRVLTRIRQSIFWPANRENSDLSEGNPVQFRRQASTASAHTVDDATPTLRGLWHAHP